MNILELSEMDPKKFREMLVSGEIPVSVHGQGYVGLPVSVLLALQGIKIIGVTKDKGALERIRKGESPIDETDPNSILSAGAKETPNYCPIDSVRLFDYEGKLFCPMCLRCYEIVEGFSVMKKETIELKGKLATLQDYLKKALEKGTYEITDDNIGAASKSFIHIITVPTYADDYSIVLKVCGEIGKALQQDGNIIINKSTVPVGATDEAERKVEENTDKQFGICHMQERIAEGRALKDVVEIPRTVGSRDGRVSAAAKVLFETLGPSVMTFSDPKITEASKIFENSYRDCNIAIANDFAFFCEKKGLNVYEVIEAANTHIKTNIYQPGMVGGHCLPEDTYYVAKPLAELGEKNVIMAGRKLNEYVPEYAVEILESELKKDGKQLKGAKVCLFGVAFKGNTDDTRLTGALPIAKLLKERGAEVFVFDPWVPKEKQEEFGTSLALEEALDTDNIIITTEHTEFYGIDYKKGKFGILLDMRNVVDKIEGKRILKFGVGR